jgi:UDP-N-acetylglucosamine--N-acetylmuramyl-(pentapeptide) pyrophosphoryl-undecaprenol N-acetylglucosamine transferase
VCLIEPMRRTHSTFAVIAGGGTAGHVLPGLAIARALVARGHGAEAIHYVGSARGIETALVPPAGFALTVLPGRGIQRHLSLTALRANAGAVWGLLRATVQGIVLMRRLRPRVVVALGGYASVPAALGALVWHVPVVVAEQNAVPGRANRIVSRWAKASATSFADTDLPRAMWTGNPVRQAVLEVDRARDHDAARARLGVPPGRQLLLVFGGSLGARRINTSVFDLAEGAWAQRGDLSVRHVLGVRDHDAYATRIGALASSSSATIDADDRLHYVAVRYEDDMPTCYAAADLALCRSGATTVADLAIVGLPAILVPLPHAPGDHQTANARALERVDAAVVVPDAELDASRLAREVDALLADPSDLLRRSRAAQSIARPDAAARVAQLAEEHARA